MIINKLYWEKYRPKKIDGVILLPRIKQQIFKDSELLISGNLLLAGSCSGTGKTSLANIIVGKSALKVNASYNSSVDNLREEVTDFCRQVGNNIFDNNYDPTKEQYKFVYLDEIDGVSNKYQEALRGFIEDNSDRVRFIGTCNNISKLSPAMLSRFTVINFDPQTAEEQKWLKDQYLERLQLIAENEKIDLDENELMAIINSSFPDLRSAINRLQVIHEGGKNAKIVNNLHEEFFNFIFKKPVPDKTYEWVISNFGDKVDAAFKMCGRPLSEYIIQYKPEYISKLPKLVPTVTKYANELSLSIDPVVQILACIYEIQTIINTK